MSIFFKISYWNQKSIVTTLHNWSKCSVRTFAEGCGYSQSTVLSRQVARISADDRSLFSVCHQHNPTHTTHNFNNLLYILLQVHLIIVIEENNLLFQLFKKIISYPMFLNQNTRYHIFITTSAKIIDSMFVYWITNTQLVHSQVGSNHTCQRLHSVPPGNLCNVPRPQSCNCQLKHPDIVCSNACQPKSYIHLEM